MVEKERDISCKLFKLLCCGSLGDAVIYYVQAAILNHCYPYLASTTGTIFSESKNFYC